MKVQNKYKYNPQLIVGCLGLFGIASLAYADFQFAMSLLKARLLPCILEYNMKSRSFSFSNDEAGRFAKHRKQHYLRYGEQGYVTLATKNKAANKVMLGKYDNLELTSYIQRAGNEYTYFDMGIEKWKEAEVFVNKNADEMWKINKEFIDRQKALGKDFYFSHEPWNAQSHEYLSKEAEYLIDLGAKDFKQIDENTWKAIW